MDNQEDIVTSIVDEYKHTLNKFKKYYGKKENSTIMNKLLIALSNFSWKENEQIQEKKEKMILEKKWILNILRSFKNNESVTTFRWYDENTQKELKSQDEWIIPKINEIRSDCIKEKWFPFTNNELALINSLLFDILWWRISFLKESKKRMSKS